MKTGKKIISVLLSVLMILPAVCASGLVAFAATPVITASGECGAEEDHLTWTLTDDGTLTITGSGEMKDYWDSRPKLSPWAGNKSVKNVVIGEGVTSIGDYAFGWCEKLVSVTLPETLTRFGEGSFAYCKTLSDVTLPDSLTRIGDEAFYRCAALTEINLTDSLEKIGAEAFAETGLISAVIPGSVRVLDGYTFTDCTSLTDVVIEEGVEEIVWDAMFGGCTSLRTVSFPASLTEGLTDSEIFTTYGGAGCDSLLKISVAKGNPRYMSDEAGALYDKQTQTLIQYPAGRKAAEYCVRKGTKSVISHAVQSESLTGIYLPSSVKKIYEGAFSGCKNLTDVYYGSTRTKLKAIEYLQADWDEDDDDMYPASYVNVGYQARFFNNAKIHYSVKTPRYLAAGECGWAGDDVFWTLTDDGTLTVAGTGVMDAPIVPYLEEESYYDAAGELFTGREVTGVAALTCRGQKYYIAKILGFEDAAGLNGALASGELSQTEYLEAKYALFDPVRKIVVGEGITGIRPYALRYGSKVNSITLPSTLKTIGEHAFECSGAQSIVIPENVEFIGNAAFYDSRLESITIKSSEFTSPSNFLYGAFRLKEIEITNDGLDISGLQLPFASQGAAYFGSYEKFVEGLTIASRLSVFADKLDSFGNKEEDIGRIMDEYGLDEAAARSFYETFFKYERMYEVCDLLDLDYDAPLDELIEYVHDYIYNAIGVDVHGQADITDEDGRHYSDAVRSAFFAAYGVDLEKANLFLNEELYSYHPISETLGLQENGLAPWPWLTVKANCGSIPHAICIAAELPFESLSHDYGDWAITKEPTSTEDGEKTRACRFCGETQTEAVSATGESGDSEPEQPEKPSLARRIIQFFLNIVNFFKKLFSKK